MAFIIDKTMGTYLPFEGDNVIMVSVGRQKLQGVEGVLNYGEIKDEDLSNLSISELMDYYCNNESIQAIIRRLSDV